MNKFSAILWIALGLFLNTNIQAQAPGLVVQAGLTTAYAKTSVMTKANQAHYGWMIGADARLLDSDLYFIIGGQYHSTSFFSTSAPNFFGKNDLKVGMGRAGIGFNILRFTERISLRSKIVGSINYVLDAPDNGYGVAGFTDINDAYAGGATGLGLTIGNLDVDLEFQYGFINAVYKQPNSTFDIWTLMAGFHF